MSLGTARSQGSSGEFINHFTGIRVRVAGTGVLRPTMHGQDSVTSSVLPTITMATTNRFSNFVLANVVEQRVGLELKTTAIDETFTIHRIVLFARPMATMTPA